MLITHLGISLKARKQDIEACSSLSNDKDFTQVHIQEPDIKNVECWASQSMKKNKPPSYATKELPLLVDKEILFNADIKA